MPHGLVIDENSSDRKLIGAELEKLGFKVGEIEAAEQGLAYCHERKPDLVLISLNGDSSSIGDFIRRMKVRPKASRPTVIVYAPEAKAETVGRSILDGAAEFLRAPFDCDILGFKLKQLGLIR